MKRDVERATTMMIIGDIQVTISRAWGLPAVEMWIAPFPIPTSNAPGPAQPRG